MGEIGLRERILASTTGSLVTTLLMTPLDVMRVRRQMWGDAVCLNGILSLWRGLGASLVFAIPSNVIYFSLYDKLRETLPPGIFSPMVAGGTARLITVSSLSPLELLRTSLYSGKYRYADVWHMATTKGPRHMWRGCYPSLLRDVPFSIVYWTLYEQLRVYSSFTAGLTAGAISTVFTMPFDVIKTKMQTDFGPKTFTHSALYIFNNHGPLAFFRGLTPRLCKVPPSCAIMITTYEYFKKYYYVPS